MGGNHCGCAERIESVAAVVAGGVMQITAIPLRMYRDYKFYQLDLCLALPVRTGIEPVSISDGSGAYPVIDTNGQPVVSGQLRGHRRYRIRYGAGGTLSSGSIAPHFTVYDGLCRMEYSSVPALQTPQSEEG